MGTFGRVWGKKRLPEQLFIGNKYLESEASVKGKVLKG